ncbi:MAG: AI-2E family transporter [Clostridiales bacterium]|nr:AI-2E family transporter [Clostridiales bacterium]
MEMKIEWNRKYTTIAIYSLIVIGVSILFVFTISKINLFFSILKKILGILSPFIMGFVIAYILNPIVKFFEFKCYNKLFKKKAKKKVSRALSLITTYLLAILVFSAIIAFIVPSVIESLFGIADNMPAYINNVQNWATDLVDKNPTLAKLLDDQIDTISTYTADFLTEIMPTMKKVLSNATIAIVAFVSGIFDVILGFIISIYILISKEKFIAQSKKILFSILPSKSCMRIIQIYRKLNSVLIRSIMGQLLDSLIVGIICFIGMTILKMPYTVLISVIVGSTNIIPFFGPFIGAIPSALLILLVDPIKMIWFLVFILILQQVDGNYIGPRIQGESTGLSAFWVIFALLVGGGLFGFAGMIIYVPLFSILYMLIRSLVEYRLEQKNLPTATSAYSGSVEHIADPTPKKQQKSTDFE